MAINMAYKAIPMAQLKLSGRAVHITAPSRVHPDQH